MTHQPARWRVLWVLLLGTALLWGAPALAQERDAKMEAVIEAANFEALAAKQEPIPASQLDPISLQVHWRLYKQVLRRGESGTDQLEALQGDSVSMGRHNLPATSFAAIHLIEAEHDAGKLPAAQASESLKALMALSPALPHPALARARHLARSSPGEVGELVSSYREGVRRMLAWPDMRIPYQFNMGLALLLAFAGASILFLLTQLLRYFSVLSYDFVRLLPAGFSSTQGMLLLLGIVIVPGLLLQSPLLSALLLLGALGCVQQLRDRVVTLLIFGVLLALPLIEARLSNALTWSSGSSRELLQSQHTVCDRRCFDTLSASWREQESKDILLDYTYWLQVYRTGSPHVLHGPSGLKEETVKAWPRSLRGYGYNLLGAAKLAQAKPQEALPLLTQAAEQLGRTTPAAYLNLLRAHQMLDDKESAQRAIDRANDIDLDATLLHLNTTRRDINSWLMVPALPAPFFWRRHEQANTQAVDLVASFWPYLAGRHIPLSWSQGMGGAGFLLVLLTAGLMWRGKTSAPCTSCGLARDPEDGGKNGNHPFCMSCYRTYVAGGSMTFQARVESEDTLNARRRMQVLTRRVLSALLPGAGHATAGYGVIGFAGMMSLLLGLLLVLRPQGVWRAPQDLLYADWLGLWVLGALLILGSLALGFYGAARDIPPALSRLKLHELGDYRRGES